MRIFVCLMIVGLMATSLGAQEFSIPTPAGELAPFKGLVGNWNGTGTASMPGGPTMNWTSKGTWKSILNGHFYQEEIRIDFEGGMPPAMVFRGYHGWDHIQKRLVSYQIGNTGELEIADTASWIGNDTYVTIGSAVKDGAPVMSRAIMKKVGDGWEFTIQSAIGAGELQPVVRGKMSPSDTEYTISGTDLSGGFAPAPEGMQKLASICGAYRMSGSMIVAPGAPSMNISAKESIQAIFNGSMIHMHVHGDPSPDDPSGFQYEGIAYLTWNPSKKCYDEFYLNNMGEIATSELRFVNEKQLVGTTSGEQYGIPHASRATLELDGVGAIRKVSMDRMNADQAVIRAFTGEYSKVKKEKKTEK